jgi:molybdate transport system substrate-binding protein
MNSAKTAFLGSVVLLGVLCYLLYREVRQTSGATETPLIVYCAEAIRVPASDIAADYEWETGQKVELRLGASQSILTNLQLTSGDLFLPADDSYIDIAREKDLVAETIPLARMQAVVITRPGLSPPIETWRDLVRPGRKLGLANPEAAAISKLLRSHLQRTGRWDEIVKLEPTFMGNINEVGNAVQIGTVDAGVVFDAVAGHFPKATVRRLPELDGVAAQIQVAVAKSSAQPTEALRFARYLAARDKGLLHLKKHGFTVAEDADLWAQTPALVVYAGAMLRPAIDETLNEFERREGVKLTRVYNGCGILVGSMKTGERPDMFFACDVQFMKQVQDLYREPATVSSNQLVIAVRKGNPHGLRQLKDLGRTALKLGVGHEQQCALGQLTKETFLASGLYGQLMKNVAVQAPTGDLLVVQLRGGALDAAVVYQSNVTPYADELDAVAIKDIRCSVAEQPVAQGKNTDYPQLTRRLLEALRTPESRRRFEELGFGWGPTP